MKPTPRLLAAALLFGASLAVQSAGILYTNDKPGDPQPLRWNTSQSIPVYADLGVYTYLEDGVTPFISNAQAYKMVGFAIGQWSQVPSSTLRAHMAGDFTKVPSIGVDITADNVGLVYGTDNGGGMHVIYDTDGRILEEYFGVAKTDVLGIAFPEWAIDTDGDGFEDTITEATALMNGYAVNINDPLGEQFTGVMTHEFGHALNLSHAQLNGPLAYMSNPGYNDKYPGVAGCVAAVHRPGAGGNDMPLQHLETMFPFINSDGPAGREMSTINQADDIAALSLLYPTAAYTASSGTISGTLRLKDGRTPYAGINIIARNVNDPLGDAVSAMSGDRTQGKAGPDGRFSIGNLKAGQSYWLYTEEIVAGGYPTTQRPLVSEAEYWNAAEGASPSADRPCDATPILVKAGSTVTADLVFNGYADGVQYTPVTDGNLVDLSKDGQLASGIYSSLQFTWHAERGIEVLPEHVLATNGSMTRNGERILVNADLDGNGINSAALWSKSGRLKNLGSLNRDRCGGSSNLGRSSSFGWAVDDDGRTAVGTAYIDVDGDGQCEGYDLPEILPFVWTERHGMKALDMSGYDYSNDGWLRAHAISGDGSVVLGGTGSWKAMAWVNQGRLIDLYKLYGAVDAYAANRDGSRVAMDTVKKVTKTYDGVAYELELPNGSVLWNAKRGGRGGVSPMGKLRWCVDMPVPPGYDYATGQPVNPCDAGADAVEAEYGAIPVAIFDISDNGRVAVGRAGNFWLGLDGVMWVDGIGWYRLSEFFRKQGVAEAYRLGMDNPLALNGAGNELVGGLVGIAQTWYVDMKQAYVCKNGRSVQTDFPNEFVHQVRSGALAGRCEHLN